MEAHYPSRSICSSSKGAQSRAGFPVPKGGDGHDSKVKMVHSLATLAARAMTRRLASRVWLATNMAPKSPACRFGMGAISRCGAAFYAASLTPENGLSNSLHTSQRGQTILINYFTVTSLHKVRPWGGVLWADNERSIQGGLPSPGAVHASSALLWSASIVWFMSCHEKLHFGNLATQQSNQSFLDQKGTAGQDRIRFATG